MQSQSRHGSARLQQPNRTNRGDPLTIRGSDLPFDDVLRTVTTRNFTRLLRSRYGKEALTKNLRVFGTETESLEESCLSTADGMILVQQIVLQLLVGNRNAVGVWRFTGRHVQPFYQEVPVRDSSL
jgi:hypothetical protein